MRFFVKAIATGFAMSLGSAIFKKVSDKMGLETEGTRDDPKVAKESDSPEPDSSDEDVPEKSR